MATTSRGYRYPVAGDSVNVNGDIQNLASDINGDMTTTLAPLPARITALEVPPQLWVYQVTGQALPAGTATGAVVWDTQVVDTANVWPQTANSRLYSPNPGKQMNFRGSVEFPNRGTGILFTLDIRKNAAGNPAAGTHLLTVRNNGQAAPVPLIWSVPMDELDLSTDYLEVFMQRSDAVAGNLSAGPYTTFAQLIQENL